MRLYLNATSKNGIGYTPDTLIIETNGKTYEYDILGEDDYDNDSLACRVKGDLKIRDNETDEFRDMTQEETQQLVFLLSGFTKDKTITVNISPMPKEEEDELSPKWVEAVNTDELGEGYGTLEVNENVSVGFRFKAVSVE